MLKPSKLKTGQCSRKNVGNNMKFQKHDVRHAFNPTGNLVETAPT